MELINGKRKESKFALQDIINNMPDNVVTNILDRLPVQDAVRTSILARSWRFNWNMLSQLVFDENFSSKIENNQVRIIISRLLLHISGAITKFFLLVHAGLNVEDEDIDHWILLLSSKGIKDLTIRILDGRELKLPSHLFSCLQLKHLELANCRFIPPSIFHGFPNLLSFKLSLSLAYSSELEAFITQCPLLESLKLYEVILDYKVKLVQIAKLKNLRILSLPLCDLNTREITSSITVFGIASSGTIFEILCSLPKLQELELYFEFCKLIEDDANMRFPTAFFGLKVLKLSTMCLDDGKKLSCAFELIRRCPNLRTLEITASDVAADLPSNVDYNTTGLLQLQNVKFEYKKGSDNELCLIKYLLASSPCLKKIVIYPHLISITSDEKLRFSLKLLKLHRASPNVDIDVSCF